MMQYVEHSMLVGGSGEGTVIESDRESNKSDENNTDVIKEQPMFVWNPKYEARLVSRATK